MHGIEIDGWMARQGMPWHAMACKRAGNTPIEHVGFSRTVHSFFEAIIQYFKNFLPTRISIHQS
jgi:hypothetical protein